MYIFYLNILTMKDDLISLCWACESLYKTLKHYSSELELLVRFVMSEQVKGVS